jgi:3',5'-cyclic AMP phosphodiesterase CpdA
VREILTPLPMPVHPLPGNHDDRDALRAAFHDHEGVANTDGFVQYAVRAGAVRIVACDTLVAGHGHGRLSPERLGWIEAELRREVAPTILAMGRLPCHARTEGCV